jgi:hypothetical protein
MALKAHEAIIQAKTIISTRINAAEAGMERGEVNLED